MGFYLLLGITSACGFAADLVFSKACTGWMPRVVYSCRVSLSASVSCGGFVRACAFVVASVFLLTGHGRPD